MLIVYIDGQKNKYSVLNECNRMLKYNIWYSKYYCVARVTKTFTLSRLQTIHPFTMASLYAFEYKSFRNTRHTVTFEYHCKALFDTPCITNWSHIEP
jgi:hypothetical protein